MRVFILIVLGIFCFFIYSVHANGHGIQIITIKNHSFELNHNELTSILESDYIKDRKLVVVSIAGPFRQGKSFLLNFFIKYLNAQYKRHIVSDWLDDGGKLDGFKWRSGQKRETTGIWVWSDIFTYDYPNGEKVAIIVMDTQGLFDHQTSMKDNTLIFALSMMMSSVQCYNLMGNVGENDLQNLRLFNEYGSLLSNQMSEKPFQKLIFIVRDWQFPGETGFGWNGTQIINEILGDMDGQTDENILVRNSIKSSFQHINGYLMPAPGLEEGTHFTGALSEIRPEFKTYVKLLTEGLFAPDKLVVKRIGGQKIQARDWIKYLNKYFDLFSGDKIPAPMDIFQATVEASNRKIFEDSLAFYIDKMEEVIASSDPVSASYLLFKHEEAKDRIIKEFQDKPKLGDKTAIQSLQTSIEKAIDRKYADFRQENEIKRAAQIRFFIEYNTQLIQDIERNLKNSVNQLIHYESDASQFRRKLYYKKSEALNEFDRKKLGDEVSSIQIRDQLERRLSNLEDDFMRTFTERNAYRYQPTKTYRTGNFSSVLCNLFGLGC